MQILNATHYQKPSKRLMPTDRTKQGLPFSFIGTNYTGPVVKQKEREISKFVYCCSPVA